MIGIVAAILASFLKQTKAEFAAVIGMVTGSIIFFYILSQLSVITEFLTAVLKVIDLEESYYYQLLKMLGVAYVAELAAAICKDAGQQAIAGMIELFGKMSIVVLSIPGLLFLVETLEQFV